MMIQGKCFLVSDHGSKDSIKISEINANVQINALIITVGGALKSMSIQARMVSELHLLKVCFCQAQFQFKFQSSRTKYRFG